MSNQQQGFGQPPPVGFYPQTSYSQAYPPNQGYQQPWSQQGGYPQQSVYPQQGGYPQQGIYSQQSTVYNFGGAQFQPTGPISTFEVEDPKDDAQFGFDDQSIRRAFIRKVYSILTVQLLISVGFISICIFNQSVKGFIRSNVYIVIVAWGISLALMIPIVCCDSVRRKAPMNFIFLFVFTVAESLFLGATSAFYNTDVVILALGLTAGVTIVLTLFAFQTKWDFTMIGGGLCAATFVLLIFGIISIFWQEAIVRLIFASIGVIIFSLWLIYDTQMLMGGKHKHSISPEEYIFAALSLYLDIVQIFLYILTIIGILQD